jgi:uncharacterized protein (DUF433 family)
MNIRVLTGVASGQPLLGEGAHPRIKDIVDRIRAGDSVDDVAEDFGVRPVSVRMLMEVAEALKFKPERGNGLDGLRHPDCLACEERKRLNLGIMEENRQLKRRLAGDVSSDEQRSAARKLWEHATEHWSEEDGEGEPVPLSALLFDSATAHPATPIKGKDLYRIGAALGFIAEVER